MYFMSNHIRVYPAAPKLCTLYVIATRMSLEFIEIARVVCARSSLNCHVLRYDDVIVPQCSVEPLRLPACLTLKMQHYNLLWRNRPKICNHKIIWQQLNEMCTRGLVWPVPAL